MPTKDQLLQIKQLQHICEQQGGFELKLNVDSSKTGMKTTRKTSFIMKMGSLSGLLEVTDSAIK